MDKKREKKIADSLRQIEKKEGISEEEARKEIAYAVSLALKSNDPKIQNFWKDIPCEGDSPTIEEVIDHIILNLPQKF